MNDRKKASESQKTFGLPPAVSVPPLEQFEGTFNLIQRANPSAVLRISKAKSLYLSVISSLVQQHNDLREHIIETVKESAQKKKEMLPPKKDELKEQKGCLKDLTKKVRDILKSIRQKAAAAGFIVKSDDPGIIVGELDDNINRAAEHDSELEEELKRLNREIQIGRKTKIAAKDSQSIAKDSKIGAILKIFGPLAVPLSVILIFFLISTLRGTVSMISNDTPIQIVKNLLVLFFLLVFAIGTALAATTWLLRFIKSLRSNTSTEPGEGTKKQGIAKFSIWDYAINFLAIPPILILGITLGSLVGLLDYVDVSSGLHFNMKIVSLMVISGGIVLALGYICERTVYVLSDKNKMPTMMMVIFCGFMLIGAFVEVSIEAYGMQQLATEKRITQLRIIRSESRRSEIPAIPPIFLFYLFGTIVSMPFLGAKGHKAWEKATREQRFMEYQLQIAEEEKRAREREEKSEARRSELEEKVAASRRRRIAYVQGSPEIQEVLSETTELRDAVEELNACRAEYELLHEQAEEIKKLASPNPEFLEELHVLREKVEKEMNNFYQLIGVNADSLDLKNLGEILDGNDGNGGHPSFKELVVKES